MNKVKIPRWLELQQEIDYLLFCTGEIYQQEIKLSTIDRMIDEATGFDKKKLQKVKRLHNKVKKLQKEYFEIIKEN